VKFIFSHSTGSSIKPAQALQGTRCQAQQSPALSHSAASHVTSTQLTPPQEARHTCAPCGHHCPITPRPQRPPQHLRSRRCMSSRRPTLHPRLSTTALRSEPNSLCTASIRSGGGPAALRHVSPNVQQALDISTQQALLPPGALPPVRHAPHGGAVTGGMHAAAGVHVGTASRP